MSRSHPHKLQRWIDLVAALLSRRFSVTFEELSRDVPGYAAASSAGARIRMFERDKEELRAFGIAIETVLGDDGAPPGYRLRRSDFYLPHIVLKRSEGDGPGIQRPGYRDLPRVMLEPDELAAIDDAALCARLLGDPVLAADAESAIRKVAFDLPAGTLASTTAIAVAAGPARVQARVFELLEHALRSRKRMWFVYRASMRGPAERREVEPYGLFLRGAEWHLAARDVASGAIRNFRLDRMDDLEVNARREQTPDYEMPAGFDLREHARQRWPWELGDDRPVDALVSFRVVEGRSAAASAARLGERVEGDERSRLFRVRRMPAFVRWLLSFGGDAIPLAPAELVSTFRTSVHETLARYRADDGRSPPVRAPAELPFGSRRGRGSDGGRASHPGRRTGRD